MGKWRLIANWEADLPSLTEDQLRGRIAFARGREDDSDRRGQKKPRHSWRQRRHQAEAELERRRESDRPIRPDPSPGVVGGDAR